MLRRSKCVHIFLQTTTKIYGCQSCSWLAEPGFPPPPLLSPFAPENLVSGSTIQSRVSPLILHNQGKSGAYSPGIPPVFRDRQRPHNIPPTAIASVPSLSGHAIVYRRRSLPRVRRHRASSHQGIVVPVTTEQVLPFQLSPSSWTN